MALGTGVYWYEATSFNQTVSSTHSAAVLAAGASSFTEGTAWPTVSNYRVIFISLPIANLSSTQISDLVSFQAQGGIVVLVAEAVGYYTGVSYLNTIASSLGVTATFNSSSLDPLCGWTATRQVTTPVLTADTPSLSYAYGTSINRGSGTVLYANTYNWVVREGHTLLVGEGNIFYGSCSGTPGNSTFTADIYNWSCDYDEDLVLNTDCGGADLDDTDAAIGSTYTWYEDFDGDGYGNSGVSVASATQPSGYVLDGTDCDDTNTGVNPGATEVCDSTNTDEDCDGDADDDDASATGQSTWYFDYDLDGYGDSLDSTEACDQPSGYVSDNTDCDDTVSTVNPGATEYCNLVDDNCDGEIDEDSAFDAATWYADADLDGFGNAAATFASCTQPDGYLSDATDCDDTRNTIYPGATEYCNSADDDCDGSTDEDSAANAATWYADADLDGYGNAASTLLSCSQPTGFVADATDCDDTRNTIYPGATEYCNNLDDNCDGSTDEDSAFDAATWYADADADGFGDASETTASCTQPSGFVTDATDCDDTSNAIYPGAIEYCNNFDDNCDGTIDESSAADAATWYADADSDGYGNPAATQVSCSQPPGYLADATDCDDTTNAISPAATEVCNDLDDDCDGATDDDDASVTGGSTWYRDADQDGVGDITTTATACDAPTGYVAVAGDCDDTSMVISPQATEICDGNNTDEDCDGLADDADDNVQASSQTTWYADGDSDGYGDTNQATLLCDAVAGVVNVSGDCNDADAAFNPGAAEACDDPTDYNCDGSVGYADADTDGFAACEDCDDASGSVNPDASEVCNLVDDNCDGSIDNNPTDAQTWEADADGDTFTNPEVTEVACAPSSGFAEPSESPDCDDDQAGVYPGAPEVSDDDIDQDCDGEDTTTPVDSGDSQPTDSEPTDSVPTDDSVGDSADSSGKEDPGCGCDSSGGPEALLMLGLAGVALRRRKAGQ